MWRPLCSLHQYTALHVTSWSESAKNPQKYRNNDDWLPIWFNLLSWSSCWHDDDTWCAGDTGDHGVTRGPLAMQRHRVNCHNERPDATFYNSIHGTVQCHHQSMNNAQWIPDDLPARGCLISPMDFELGNYNVSQLPRQSRHKEQSWLSSCPDSFHRISGSRRISQLITQS